MSNKPGEFELTAAHPVPRDGEMLMTRGEESSKQNG